MESPTRPESSSVIQYLRDEVPWEMERLESIDRLIRSRIDWGADHPNPRHANYSSWLRQTYGLFHPRSGLDSVA
jgi:hypothetical protein